MFGFHTPKRRGALAEAGTFVLEFCSHVNASVSDPGGVGGEGTPLSGLNGDVRLIDYRLGAVSIFHITL